MRASFARDSTVYLDDWFAAVAGDRRDVCSSPREVPLRGAEGYISNLIAEESSLGTLTCPWSIQAKSSQSIKLSVYDFGSVVKSDTDDKWTRINYSGRNCPTFLSVEEVSTGEQQRMALCGDGVRFRHLYTSNTHRLRLHFTTLTSFSDLPYFLVKYESTWHSYVCRRARKGKCKLIRPSADVLGIATISAGHSIHTGHKRLNVICSWK